MKISKEELQKIINEEVNEIFGFGKKKKSSKEYPAAELATIMRGLASASKMTGIQLTPEQREAVVDELTDLLEDEGFAIKENERLFTGEGDVVITSQKAPKLKVFLDAVAKKDPKVFNQLSGLFRRSALDISPVAKAIMPATVSPSPSSTGAPAAAAPVSKPATPPATPAPVAAPGTAPPSGLKNLKPGEVMVALNQLGLRQGTIERAAKKALANRGLTKADRENIEAVAKQLISYLEGGLKESKIIVGPAAMRMIEELYENRWKEITGIK